jgi:N-acylglucosamine 2-epimerase
MPIDLSILAADSRSELLERVLPWWFRHGVDSEYGGVLSMLSESGAQLGTDKFVWSQARWLWVLSAVYNRIAPEPYFSQAAEHTAQFLLRHGRNHDGKWFYRLTREGGPIEGPISVFSDCFAVYGLSEYYRLSGDRKALEVAVTTFEKICARVEEADFTEIAPYSMRPGLRAHGVHMMLVETANELSITLGGSPEVDAIAAGAMERLLENFLQPDSGLIVEFLDRDYRTLPPSEGTLVVPGHAIEAMWFVAHFALRIGRHDLLPLIREITLRHVEYGWDSVYGGLLLNRDLKGGTPHFPHGDKKLWWPYTEALYALPLLWSLQPDEQLATWFQRIHDWTYAHFPNPGGEWQQRLNREGGPVTDVVALPVKDPFHLPRTLILLSKWNESSGFGL